MHPRWFLIAALLLALGGVGLLLLAVPSAMESRRVWQHQTGKVAELEQEYTRLSQQPDGRSRMKALEIRDKLDSGFFTPDWFRDEYYMRLGFAALGVAFGFTSGTLGLIWLAKRKNHRGTHTS